jgi:glycine cleavage system aminomethyltransferase T
VLALQAGADLGVRDAGYYALDALRIEAGRRAWGAELGPDETPFEAGLAYAVSLDKPAFIGREALVKFKADPQQPRRIGLEVTGRRVPREHCPVLAGDGRTQRGGQGRPLAQDAAELRADHVHRLEHLDPLGRGQDNLQGVDDR